MLTRFKVNYYYKIQKFLTTLTFKSLFNLGCGILSVWVEGQINQGDPG